jgi:hypothetical protein
MPRATQGHPGRIAGALTGCSSLKKHVTVANAVCHSSFFKVLETSIVRLGQLFRVLQACEVKKKTSEIF